MSEWKCASCGYEHLSGEKVRCCPFPEREASTLEPVLSVAEVLGIFTAELKIAKAWTPELQAHYDQLNFALQAMFYDSTQEYQKGRFHGYTSGYYAAIADALNYLNTLEDRSVEKKTVYAALMEMRPPLPEPPASVNMPA